MNKTVVTEKFYNLVSIALTVQKQRRPTRPTLSSKIKRLDLKHSRAVIKKFRKDSGEAID